jgi:diamine N-acetyltransferase
MLTIPPRLRAFRDSDIDFALAIEARAENAAFIGRWPRGMHEERYRGPDFQYWLVESATGDRLGYVILNGLRSPHRAVELARIALDAPGRGQGAAVFDLVFHHVFEVLGAHRFWLDVFPTNTRAQRLYAKVGFVTEGTLREAFLADGEYRPLTIMSLLAHEYRARLQAASSDQ